ncbi:MAG: tRNA uridine-5-carboxymethylaminomethyl(34) synthesis GTPase MnmE [Pseudomonadota bacterium]
MTETIVALASGVGRAGVAVVRVSGPGARRCLQALIGRGPLPPERRLSLRRLRASDGSEIDEAMVVWFGAPATYTGEDIVELHLHGGRAITDAAVRAARELGPCRIAEPGEFTRRAFDNGRLDLTRAEAVADLIDAETEGQRRQALRQFDGQMQAAFETWRDRLIQTLAALEAAIDFPDEGDIPETVDAPARALLVNLRADLEAALADVGRGAAIRDGFQVAILGAPNAGKSSLLNRLARRDAAIVSDVPGTTRDIVEVRMDLGGFPVWLSDTAGLRETADKIEQEGVRRALDRASNADLRILVLDASDPRMNLDVLSGDDLVVVNKTDLPNAAKVFDVGLLDRLDVSALTGDGLDGLVEALTGRVVERLSSDAPPIVTRERHRNLLSAGLDHINRALIALDRNMGVELASEDVRLATRALGRVTGTVDVEDLLDRIFSEFCVGK